MKPVKDEASLIVKETLDSLWKLSERMEAENNSRPADLESERAALSAAKAASDAIAGFNAKVLSQIKAEVTRFEEIATAKKAAEEAAKQAELDAIAAEQKENHDWLNLMSGFINMTDMPISIIARVVDDLRRLDVKPKDALPAFKVAHERWLQDEKEKAATRPEAYGSWA